MHCQYHSISSRCEQSNRTVSSLRGRKRRTDFAEQWYQELLIYTVIQISKRLAIADKGNPLNQKFKNKRSRKVALKPVRQTLISRKKKGKSKALSRGFGLFDSGAEE